LNPQGDKTEIHQRRKLKKRLCLLIIVYLPLMATKHINIEKNI